MSTFSTAMATFQALIQGIPEYANKTIIPNPYDISDNQISFLRDGYGIVIQDSTNVPTNFNMSSDLQQVGVVVSKDIPKTNSDPTAIMDGVIYLKDTLTVLRLALLECTDMAGIATLTYENTDSFTTEEGFIYTTIIFNIMISDTINC